MFSGPRSTTVVADWLLGSRGRTDDPIVLDKTNEILTLTNCVWPQILDAQTETCVQRHCVCELPRRAREHAGRPRTLLVGQRICG